MSVKGIKRICITLMVAMIATSILPTAVFAAEETSTETTTETTVTDESKKDESNVDVSEGTPEESEPPATTEGWIQNEDGSISYILNGNKLTGFQEIEDNYYFFNAEGVMQKGLQTVEGKKRYFGEEDGKMVKSKLVTIEKYQYYFDAEGVMVKGTTAKIGSAYYLFSTTGKRYTTTGLKTVGNDKYYVISKTGKVSTKGWQAVIVKSGKKQYKRAYYCTPESGVIAKKGAKIGYVKIPSKGYLGEAYYYGVKTLDKNGWSLKSAFNYSKKLKYYGRSYRTKYVETYALRGFKTKKGNCYVMAATFNVQAKLLGYDIKQVYGKVDLPHSWTEVKHNGKTYVYDPNFTNETGRNGYKIYYGKKGTWRYHKFGNVKYSY